MKSNTAVQEAPETVVAVLPKSGSVSPREEELESEVSEIEAMALAVSVQNDEEYEAAGKFGVMLKKKAAEVTEFFKPLKDSAYKAHKAICDREKEMLTPLRKAEMTLKKTMGDYAMEQERKRREAEEAARRARRSPAGSWRRRPAWRAPEMLLVLRRPSRTPKSARTSAGWCSSPAEPRKPRAFPPPRIGRSSVSTARMFLWPSAAWRSARWMWLRSCASSVPAKAPSKSPASCTVQ